MTRGGSAAAPPRAARWIVQHIAVALAVALILAAPTSARAETGGTPLIQIPPAKLRSPASPASVAARIEPAPRALLPTDVQVLRDSPGAGITMYGALNGEAASATGVVLAIFVNSEAFDPTPSLRLVLADEGDRHAQALFTATVHGAPVTGIAGAALGDAGGDVTVFYDDADAFADSFPRMREALAQMAVVEIGRSDNSVCEAQIAGGYNANAGWTPVSAALAAMKAAEAQIDNSPAQSLADLLSADTGQSWRIVRPAEIK